MKKLRTAVIGIDEGECPLFSDHESDGPMWSGEGTREVRHAVTFNERFAALPTVRVALTMWDMDAGANARVDVVAEHVTPAGFDIRFRTWGDTRIARVRVGWLAIGPLPDDDLWDLA